MRKESSFADLDNSRWDTAEPRECKYSLSGNDPSSASQRDLQVHSAVNLRHLERLVMA